MKMIVAIIRPEKFEDVQDALDTQQIHLMTAIRRPRLRKPARLFRILSRKQGRYPPPVQGETRNCSQRSLCSARYPGHPQSGPIRTGPNRRRQNLRSAAG